MYLCACDVHVMCMMLSFPAVTTVSVPAVLSVAEGQGTVQACVTLTIASSAAVDITVTLATSDGTGMRYPRIQAFQKVYTVS